MNILIIVIINCEVKRITAHITLDIINHFHPSFPISHNLYSVLRIKRGYKAFMSPKFKLSS